MDSKLPHGSSKTMSSPAIESRSTTKGWMSRLPTAWIPYLQLMRLDRYNGYWYFWLPHFYGTLLAARELHSTIPEFLDSNIVLVWAVLIMRGAACTWNDTVDAPFDRQVSRCKNRPVARRAVTVWQAHTFTLIQTALCIITLSYMPRVCWLYAVPGFVMHFLYPLAKRVTYYPQVVLGFPMAWGIFMGAASLGADPLNLVEIYEQIQPGPQMDWNVAASAPAIGSPATVAFFAANVIWVLLFELIYSHQDAPEDAAAGVKSLVLLYADTTGEAIEFSTMTLLVKLGVGQILLLAVAGALGAGDSVYFTGTVAGAAASTAVILSKVCLTDPDDCAWWFKVGCARNTGGAMAAGLLGEYLLQQFLG